MTPQAKALGKSAGKGYKKGVNKGQLLKHKSSNLKHRLYGFDKASDFKFGGDRTQERDHS